MKAQVALVLLIDLLQRMQTDPPAGVSASPVADNVMTWYVMGTRRREGFAH